MALVLGVVLCTGTGCRQQGDAPEAAPADAGFKLLAAGAPVPEYRAVTPGGDTLDIGTEQPVTLLNLWATWCGPCLKEFPELERLHQELGLEGLRIVAVDVDPDPPQAVLGFAAELGITFTVALDPAGRIEERFQSMALPSSYLIDRDGRLVARWTGALKPEDFAAIRDHFAEM